VTQRQRGPSLAAGRRCRQTFIFSYILERKGEAGVLALDNAHLAKGSLADDSQQPEVIQVHCLLWSAVLVLVLASLLAGVAGADRMQQGP
jgi:hypothetical protein